MNSFMTEAFRLTKMSTDKNSHIVIKGRFLICKSCFESKINFKKPFCFSGGKIRWAKIVAKLSKRNLGKPTNRIGIKMLRKRNQILFRIRIQDCSASTRSTTTIRTTKIKWEYFSFLGHLSKSSDQLSFYSNPL